MNFKLLPNPRLSAISVVKILAIALLWCSVRVSSSKIILTDRVRNPQTHRKMIRKSYWLLRARQNHCSAPRPRNPIKKTRTKQRRPWVRSGASLCMANSLRRQTNRETAWRKMTSNVKIYLKSCHKRWSWQRHFSTHRSRCRGNGASARVQSPVLSVRWTCKLMPACASIVRPMGASKSSFRVAKLPKASVASKL